MKNNFIFLPILFGILSSVTAVDVYSISPSEADAIVEAELASKADREAALRARLQEVPAIQEWEVHTGEGKSMIRRVEPPLPPKDDFDEAGVTNPQLSQDEAVAPPTDPRPHESLTLFITVFDEEVTELRSIHGNGGEAVTTLSNIDWSWFPGISTIRSESVVYTVLAFVEQVGPEGMDERPRPDPPIFSTSGPEYVIVSAAEAPPGAVEAIEAFHRHYVENMAHFEAQAQREKALKAARERRNPPPPRETTINIWRVDHASEDRQ